MEDKRVNMISTEISYGTGETRIVFSILRRNYDLYKLFSCVIDPFLWHLAAEGSTRTNQLQKKMYCSDTDISSIEIARAIKQSKITRVILFTILR